MKRPTLSEQLDADVEDWQSIVERDAWEKHEKALVAKIAWYEELVEHCRYLEDDRVVGDGYGTSWPLHAEAMGRINDWLEAHDKEEETR